MKVVFPITVLNCVDSWYHYILRMFCSMSNFCVSPSYIFIFIPENCFVYLFNNRVHTDLESKGNYLQCGVASTPLGIFPGGG